MLIDTHAHIYHPQFQAEVAAMLQRSVAAGVTKILMPNIDSQSMASMLQLAERYPDICYPMMGIHPCQINADYEAELAIAAEQLATRSFIAIGEIGIDLYWSKDYWQEQQVAFRQQLQWAKKYRLPAVIHCRNAFEETIRIVEEEQDGSLSGVFHCFVGNAQDAQRVIEAGFMLGIGGVLTFKNSGLSETLLHVPLAHLILETDSPYLAPVPHRGKRNEPAYTALVAQHLANLKQVSIEEIARITSENAQKLFQLP